MRVVLFLVREITTGADLPRNCLITVMVGKICRSPKSDLEEMRCRLSKFRASGHIAPLFDFSFVALHSLDRNPAVRGVAAWL